MTGEDAQYNIIQVSAVDAFVPMAVDVSISKKVDRGSLDRIQSPGHVHNHEIPPHKSEMVSSCWQSKSFQPFDGQLNRDPEVSASLNRAHSFQCTCAPQSSDKHSRTITNGATPHEGATELKSDSNNLTCYVDNFGNYYCVRKVPLCRILDIFRQIGRQTCRIARFRQTRPSKT